MSMLSPGPNTKTRTRLTPRQTEVLGQLYLKDGAWTREEALSHLGEGPFRVFLKAQVLGRQDTDMGEMYHLLAHGRVAVYGGSDASVSLQSQLDQAYVRLSLQQLEWEILTEGNPFFKNLASLFPTVKFIEASGSEGRVLVIGKLTGGGYTTDGIKRIARIVRSSALSRGFRVVVLTPHPRKGFEAAKRNANVIQMVQVLPNQSASSRFGVMPAYPSDQRPEQGAALGSTTVAQFRKRAIFPELTLGILMLNRSERIELAQIALDVDRALSATQLQRYYGINPQDLTGRLSTSAIVRPSKGRSATEVQQRIVVADRKVARLDDGNLVHRLTTAQMCLQLGIPADPERWIVESRGSLPVEEPDAIYIDADGSQNAIEADTGHYSVTTVLRKLESFHDQSYQETIWALFRRPESRT